MKTFKQFLDDHSTSLDEDAVAVNSAGAGNVPAIGIGPDGEPPAKMAMVRRKKKEDEIK
jgi:hypothetical protein